MKETRWRPDTCDCVITILWDADLPEDQRIHTVSEVIPCAEHAALNLEGIWAWVMYENVLKNDVLDKARNYLDSEAKITYFRDKYQISWYFTGSGEGRILHVVFPTLNTAQKALVQSYVDQELGAGKIVIE